MQTGLYYACFPGAVVILDLLPDRYRLLQGDAATRFQRLTEGIETSDDRAWLDSRDIGAETIRQQPDGLLRPNHSIDCQASHRVRKLFVLKAIFLQYFYRRKLRSTPLHAVLENLEGKRPRKSRDEVRIEDIASAFERAKQIIPTRDLCLPRALAMTHLYFSSGVGVQLVFGVTLPFSAHCWVQLGDLVLSDPLDRVLPFQPIMVLE